MSKNVLFILHGVGSHSSDWATEDDGPITALKTAAKKYEFFQQNELDDYVEFVPIRYDDIFDKILEKWGELRKAVISESFKSKNFYKTFTNLLDQVSDDENQFILYGGDAILYKGFPLYSKRILLRILSTIVSSINKSLESTAGPTPRFYVMAHSLGTAVAHDAIHYLGSATWLDIDKKSLAKLEPSSEQEIDDSIKNVTTARVRDNSVNELSNPFAPDYFKFETIFMISNTSNLMHTTDVSPKESLVQTLAVGAARTSVKKYYNYDHKFDPLSKVKPYIMPTKWQQEEGHYLGRSVVDLEHFYDANVHGYSHYLLHPRVHVPILKQLITAGNGFQLSDTDWKLIDEFSEWGGDLGRIKEQLETLQKQASKAGNLKDWIDLIKNLQAVAAL